MFSATLMNSEIVVSHNFSLNLRGEVMKAIHNSVLFMFAPAGEEEKYKENESENSSRLRQFHSRFFDFIWLWRIAVVAVQTIYVYMVMDGMVELSCDGIILRRGNYKLICALKVFCAEDRGETK
jgi:hypothetical protein